MSTPNESPVRVQQKLCGSVTPSCPEAQLREDNTLTLTDDNGGTVTFTNHEALALRKFLETQLPA